MSERYEPRQIERKWQQVWEREQAFHAPNPDARRPRAARRRTWSRCSRTRRATLHMGHVLNYTIGDVVSHLRRRSGCRVLRPMGYDAFGLPAENAAIREGVPPRDIHRAEHRRIRAQMRRMGWAIDWDREISTHEPAYYRWTQWLFLRFFERGLAYRKESPGQVVSRTTRPCSPTSRWSTATASAAARRSSREEAEQWFFRITDYADALLDELETARHGPSAIMTMQRNWIGRSEGAESSSASRSSDEELAGLHDAPGHALRRHVLRARSRAPARRRS